MSNIIITSGNSDRATRKSTCRTGTSLLRDQHLSPGNTDNSKTNLTFTNKKRIEIYKTVMEAASKLSHKRKIQLLQLGYDENT